MSGGLSIFWVLGTVTLIPVIILAGYAIFQIIRWKAYIWLPAYCANRLSKTTSVPESEKHVIFVMVDHFEPGSREPATKVTEDWLAQFRAISDRHADAYGNRFRYSWFYPFDHHHEPSLKMLAKEIYDGYGEVELHWHHPPATNDTFPRMLDEAIAWYQRYGLFLTSGDTPVARFAFIHGSWGLDDSYVWISDGKPRRCGVSQELDILRNAGCYADFTFPAFGTKAQPHMANSIYYAVDTPEPKSYDYGKPATVGSSPRPEEFMIFQGPLGVDLLGRKFEYGAVEYYDTPNPRRIEQWLDANIHVDGRPEWVFVKVYSHGIQSTESILKKHLDLMLTDLEGICRKRKNTLHYMTAREAYNVVKAAESGKRGNPDEFRDFSIPRPCAAVFQTDTPVLIRSMSPSKVAVDVLSPACPVEVQMKEVSLESVKGMFSKFSFDSASKELTIEAGGPVEVISSENVTVKCMGGEVRVLINQQKNL